MGRCGLDASWSGWGPMTGFCEHNNKPVCLTEGGGVGISGLAERLLASQEGLCSTELVN